MAVLADEVDVVIGVDPHKYTHTAAFLDTATGKKLAAQTTAANPNGFAKLLSVADAHPGTRCWVIEGCGSWGRGLASWLLAADEKVREIDSPKRTSRRMGKKTDDIDATRAAREALARDDLAVPRSIGDRDALAALLVARRSSIQMATDTERQLHALASTCPEVLAARLRGLKTHRIVSLCNRWRPSGDSAVLAIADAMRQLARRVRYLRAEAKL